MRLTDVISTLKTAYGAPRVPAAQDPWPSIVRENVAYLADDEAREAAFQALEASVGLEPRAILAARASALTAVAKGRGILPAQAATKLKRAARIALDDWDGDVAAAVKRPVPEALRALKKFPGIGEPGAERLLLFARRHPVLALDSNGLRVLLRVGFGTEARSYATTYRSVRRAVEAGSPREYRGLIEAHLLLRRHGRETCKRSRPRCDTCPLSADCAFARAGAGAGR